MTNKTTKHVLGTQEVVELRTLIRKGTHKSREVSRAEILLLTHEGKTLTVIAERVRKSTRTVQRVRDRFYTEGLARAIHDAPRSGQPSKTSVEDDAHLVALACTEAPAGSTHWSLVLLQEKFKKDRKKTICTTAIWNRLTTRGIKPWVEKNVVHTSNNPSLC